MDFEKHRRKSRDRIEELQKALRVTRATDDANKIFDRLRGDPDHFKEVTLELAKKVLADKKADKEEHADIF